MAFDWEDFLHIAKHLDQMCASYYYTDESLKRNVMSRSYYSVFCSVRNYLIQKHSYPPKGNMRNSEHKRLTDFLQKIGFYNAKKILLTMKRYRVQADYLDIISSNINVMASDSLKQAQIIMNMINNGSFN